MKTIIFLITVVLTALSAGIFFAWSVSVIPGTKKITDLSYLETMQSINKEILNPVFFAVFFGSLVFLVINSITQFHHKPTFWLVLSAMLVYAIGTFGFTAFGNVPLNNELDSLNLKELTLSELKSFRIYYERYWNGFHNVRTIAGFISFLLLLISIFIKK